MAAIDFRDRLSREVPCVPDLADLREELYCAERCALVAYAEYRRDVFAALRSDCNEDEWPAAVAFAESWMRGPELEALLKHVAYIQFEPSAFPPSDDEWEPPSDEDEWSPPEDGDGDQQSSARAALVDFL